MAPSSITIKLDFGAGANAGNHSMSLDGGVPTPFSSAAHSHGPAESAAPAPSLGLAPAGSTVWAHDVSQQEDVPTPVDNAAHAIGVDGGPAPDPQMASPASADLPAPEPSQDDDGAGVQH
ncbi:hypothetical protein NHH73_19075 [Oxalobacteraceae bacterium OTU3CINTB1]|nr:hypothetical protein NHH73_19075 [Oxalobacteraceae bacterium OTU3CINTB1]